MSGVLYRKPRVHSSFRKCVVILCHGKLLIFQSTLRAKAGKEVPHILHEREEVVDLKDSYIYSGLVRDSNVLPTTTAVLTKSSSPREIYSTTTRHSTAITRAIMPFRASIAKTIGLQSMRTQQHASSSGMAVENPSSWPTPDKAKGVLDPAYAMSRAWVYLADPWCSRLEVVPSETIG